MTVTTASMLAVVEESGLVGIATYVMRDRQQAAPYAYTAPGSAGSRAMP